MFSHIVLGSNDIERSRRFYDAIFRAVGGLAGELDAKGRLIYRHRNNTLMITKPLDGEPACHANGGTIGFAMDGPDQVDAWHSAGKTAGDISIEDPPGIRENSVMKLYLAYLRDPDGNKFCATHRGLA